MTLSTIKDNCSFHERLLIDAAIEAARKEHLHHEAKSFAHTVEKIAKDYCDIMSKHFTPVISNPPIDPKEVVEACDRATAEFNAKYGITIS